MGEKLSPREGCALWEEVLRYKLAVINPIRKGEGCEHHQQSLCSGHLSVKCLGGLLYLASLTTDTPQRRAGYMRRRQVDKGGLRKKVLERRGPGDVPKCLGWRGKEIPVRTRQVMATMDVQGQDSRGFVKSQASVAGRGKLEGDRHRVTEGLGSACGKREQKQVVAITALRNLTAVWVGGG